MGTVLCVVILRYAPMFLQTPHQSLYAYKLYTYASARTPYLQVYAYRKNICTFTSTNTNTNTNTNTSTNAYTGPCTHTYTYACICIYRCIHMYIYLHTHICICICTCVYTAQACIHWYTRAYIYTCVYIYIRVFIYTCIHMHTCTFLLLYVHIDLKVWHVLGMFCDLIPKVRRPGRACSCDLAGGLLGGLVLHLSGFMGPSWSRGTVHPLVI